MVSLVNANNDVDATKLTLIGEAGDSYVLTTTKVDISSATGFSVTLNAADKLTVNGLLNKDGTSSDNATTYNLAAVDNWMTAAAASTDISDTTLNGITVSNVTKPAITAASYDGATGTLVVTGSNFVSKSGASNDVDISLFALTGEGGAPYTLTGSSDIEVTSATTFTLALSDADKNRVNSLLNKTGNNALDNIAYNLAAADNWMAGAAATTDIKDVINTINTTNLDTTNPVDAVVSSPTAPLTVSTASHAITGSHGENGGDDQGLPEDG